MNYYVQQESNFWYLFGVEEADCYGLLETDTGKATVFMHKYSEDQKMWQYIPTLEEVKEKWALDEVLYENDL